MNNLYVALDFPSWDETNAFIKKHDFHGLPVKVGMELFYREGPAIIHKLKENNHPIFLDLKLHDIPTTVYKAMKNIAKLEVDIINVHALGGKEMMKRAKEGLLSGASMRHETKLIAVTILTSFDKPTLNDQLLIDGGIEENAIHLAEMAEQSGADGVVCSVHEANQVKEACGSDFLTVTPGIRLLDSNQDDQKRVATPEFAKNNGADILVIGRTVTQATDPVKAYEQVCEGWNGNEK